MKRRQILVQDTPVAFSRVEGRDYISLTDIARFKNPDEPKDVVKNWLRSRATIEFLGLWEGLPHPGFKRVDFDPLNPVEFDGIRSVALTPYLERQDNRMQSAELALEAEAPRLSGPNYKALKRRLDKLQTWQSRARTILPVIGKML